MFVGFESRKEGLCVCFVKKMSWPSPPSQAVFTECAVVDYQVHSQGAGTGPFHPLPWAASASVEKSLSLTLKLVCLFFQFAFPLFSCLPF